MLVRPPMRWPTHSLSRASFVDTEVGRRLGPRSAAERPCGGMKTLIEPGVFQGKSGDDNLSLLPRHTQCQPCVKQTAVTCEQTAPTLRHAQPVSIQENPALSVRLHQTPHLFA